MSIIKSFSKSKKIFTFLKHWHITILALTLSSLTLSSFCHAGSESEGINSQESMQVAFINPNSRGNPFWDLVTSYMLAASRDLNINLDVHYANKNRYRSLDIAKTLLTSDTPPSYLVYIYQLGSGKEILALAETKGVKSFIINTDIHPQEKSDIGKPRSKFKHWLGHIFPDDAHAGRMLAEYLIDEAAARKMHDNEGKIQVVGLSGSLDSAPSILRNQGLSSAVADKNYAKLNQIVFAQWNPSTAQRQVDTLLKRYPETAVIWAASDGMGIASANSLADGAATKARPLIGSIDWTETGLEGIQNGKLDASVGGHFMGGSTALVLLHDYDKGKDFLDFGVQIQYQMDIIHKDNIADYSDRISSRDVDQIDFNALSRVNSPELKAYDFSFKTRQP